MKKQLLLALSAITLASCNAPAQETTGWFAKASALAQQGLHLAVENRPSLKTMALFAGAYVGGQFLGTLSLIGYQAYKINSIIKAKQAREKKGTLDQEYVQQCFNEMRMYAKRVRQNYDSDIEATTWIHKNVCRHFSTISGVFEGIYLKKEIEAAFDLFLQDEHNALVEHCIDHINNDILPTYNAIKMSYDATILREDLLKEKAHEKDCMRNPMLMIGIYYPEAVIYEAITKVMLQRVDTSIQAIDTGLKRMDERLAKMGQSLDEMGEVLNK